MLLVAGAVLVLLGAWHLLAPRTSFLVRRTERPGRYLSRAQLSSARTRGAAVAVLGLVVLAVSSVAATTVVSGQVGADEAARGWGVETSMGPGRVEIVDPSEASTDEGSALAPAGTPSGSTPALRWAVVGSAENDPRVEVPGTVAGDLLVRVAPGRCEVTRVLVDEGENAVRLTVLVEAPLFGGPPPTGRPVLDGHLAGEAPAVGLGTEPFADPRCDARGSGLSLLAPVQLVRVGLDRPLGDRRVVDAPTGAVVAPVAPPEG